MPKAQLPENFDASAYIDAMSPVVGLELDEATQAEVAKLLTIAHNMATIVYDAPVDDNSFDLANVYSPAAEHKHD